MTSKLDVVRAWTDMPAGNLEESAAYLSDDFQNVDEEGNVIVDKAGWIGMGQMLYGSLPDIKYVRTGLRQEGNFVLMTGHFEGTFERDLDLSAMGAGVIPANGKRIVWPDTSSKFMVEGDKIIKEEQYGESGGLEAFLAPLMG